MLRFLQDGEGTGIVPPPELFGFGGLHGGLLLGRAAACCAAGDDRRIVAITGHFHRSVREPFDLNVRPVRTRKVSTGQIEVAAAGIPLVTATAISASPAAGFPTLPEPPLPSGASTPLDWDVFSIPPAFVPVSETTEIRPVGAARPYQAGDRADLMAWVRIRDGALPNDAARLVFLMDSLAPSYAAIFPELTAIPTVELSVRPTGNLAGMSSPWVLLHARTDSADGSGWSHERIDAWTEDGDHLGVATQLRLARKNSTTDSKE